MLLRIISRSLDADQPRRGKAAPVNALRPARTLCLRKVLRLIPTLSKPIVPPGSEFANRAIAKKISAQPPQGTLTLFSYPSRELFRRGVFSTRHFWLRRKYQQDCKAV